MRSIPSRTAPRSWQRSSNGSAPLGLSTRRRSILQPIVGSRLPGTIGGTWWLGGASGRAYWPTCCWGPREASPEHLRSVALPGALEPRRPRSGERRGAGTAARPWRARGLAAALPAGLGGRSRGRGLARANPDAVPDRAPVLPPSLHRRHGSDRRSRRAVSGCARSRLRAGLSRTLGSAGSLGSDHSILERRQGLQDLARPRPNGNGIVLADPAVAEDDHPPGELGDVELVGDEHDGQAAVVEVLEDLHDLDRGAAVEVPGRLVRQQDPGAVHQGAGDGDALLLADRM